MIKLGVQNIVLLIFFFYLLLRKIFFYLLKTTISKSLIPKWFNRSFCHARRFLPLYCTVQSLQNVPRRVFCIVGGLYGDAKKSKLTALTFKGIDERVGSEGFLR